MKMYEREAHLAGFTDEALMARSNSIRDKIIDFEQNSNNLLIKERTIPALARLQQETDDIYLDREESFDISRDKLAEKFEVLMKGRKDSSKVARAVVAGMSFSEISTLVFGDNSEPNREKTEIWLNFLKLQVFEPEGVKMNEVVGEDEDIRYTFSERKKRIDKINAEKPAPLMKDFVSPESRLNGLDYLAKAKNIHLHEILDLLGETKANRKLVWSQAVIALKLATSILRTRVVDEGRKLDPRREHQPLSEREKSVWENITRKCLELEENEGKTELTPKEVSTSFVNFFQENLDPRQHPEILWASQYDDEAEEDLPQDETSVQFSVIDESEAPLPSGGDTTLSDSEKLKKLAATLLVKNNLTDEEKRVCQEVAGDTTKNLDIKEIKAINELLSNEESFFDYIGLFDDEMAQELLFILADKKELFDSLVQNSQDTSGEPLEYVEKPTAPKRMSIEKDFEDIREKASAKVETVAKDLPNKKLGFMELTTMYRGKITDRDIHLAINEKLIIPARATDGRDAYTREHIAIILLRKELGKAKSFTNTGKKELRELIRQEFEKLEAKK